MPKVVIVTGATKGLGKALAEKYLAEGHTVIATGRTETALEELKTAGAITVAGDITDDATRQKLFAAAKERIDILINNAGMLYSQPVEENTPEQWDRIFSVNVKAPMLLAQQAFGLMREQGDGHIVNIVSTVGKEGRPNMSLYASTKFALAGFTESLRAEAKPHGVRVTGMFPGGMQTELFDTADAGTDTSEFMDPAEVAQLIYDTTERTTISVDEILLNRMSK